MESNYCMFGLVPMTPLVNVATAWVMVDQWRAFKVPATGPGCHVARATCPTPLLQMLQTCYPLHWWCAPHFAASSAIVPLLLLYICSCISSSRAHDIATTTHHTIPHHHTPQQWLIHLRLPCSCSQFFSHRHLQ